MKTFEQLVLPPRTAWWTFSYSDKPREALVFGSNDHGNMFCWTPDGFRSFKPAKMIGIEDKTCVATN